MARTREEGSVEDAEFLRLRQLGKDVHVRISDSAITLDDWPGRLSLFTISNKFGCFAAGLNDSFVVAPTQRLRAAFDGTSSYSPQYRNALPSPPVIMKFTSDGERLVVCTRDGRVLVYTTPRDSTAETPSQTPKELALLHEIKYSSQPIRDVQPNPSDRPETVAVLRGSEGSSSAVEILDTKTGQQVGNMPASAGTSFQTAISWSPKGKQIAVGTQAGQIIQYGADGSQKGMISSPEDGQQSPVVSIAWLENTVLAVTYRESDADPQAYIVVHDGKAGSTKYISLEDPAPPWGLASRETARSYVHLKAWNPTKHMLFVTDAPADDIGVLACFEGANPRWAKLDLDDTARGSVPMAEDGSSATLVGFDVDLSSTTSISMNVQAGDDNPPVPPAPIIFGYSSEGIVIAYHAMNSRTPSYPGMLPLQAGPAPPSITIASPPQTPTGPVAKAPSTTPAVPPPTFGFGAFASTTPKAPFGQPASFGQSTFGASTTPFGTPSQPAPAFGQSAFGATTTPSFGKPAFGAPTTPASTSAFGASTTPAFGQPAFGATTTPAFGRPAFGSTTPSTTPAATGFGAASAKPAFGAATAKPAFGQANFGFGSSTASPFGASTSGTGFASFASKAPDPATGATSASTPGSTSSPAGFGAFAQPSSSAGPSFATTKKSDIAPATGGFGAGLSKPSLFAATTPAPTLGLPKAADAAATTKPTFGSTTSFGGSGFGKPAKPAADLPPVKVTPGSAFGSFAASSGGFFGGSAAAAPAGDSFAALLGGGKADDSKDNLEPPKSAMSLVSASPAGKPWNFGKETTAQRAGSDDEEEEGDKKERFPEAVLEAKEPTVMGGDFLAEGWSPKKPPPSATPKPAASPSGFSMMSLGTVRADTSSSSPAGIQTLFTRPSPGPSSAIPMSTTSIFFGQRSEAGPSPRGDESPVPPTEGPPDDGTAKESESENSDEEAEGEDGEQVDDEDGEQVEASTEEEEEEEEEEEDEGEFAISAPLSPVTEEGETASGVDDSNDDEAPGPSAESSYVFAERPTRASPSDSGMLSTPRGRTPSQDGSTTPVGSPIKGGALAIPSPPSESLSPTAPNGDKPTSPTMEGAPSRGLFARGRSPFVSTPVVSSPLANPPISGPSPTKTDQAGDDVEQSPTASRVAQPGPSAAIEIPLPDEEGGKKKPSGRPKTPPAPFGLGFGGGGRAKPTAVLFGLTDPSPFGASSNPFAQQSTPQPSPPTNVSRPTFAAPAFSFSARTTPPPPVTSPAPSWGAPPAAPKPAPVSIPPSAQPTRTSSPFGVFGAGGPPTFGSKAPTQPAPALQGLSKPAQSPSPSPITSNPLEAQFLRIISMVEQDLGVVRDAITQLKSQHVALLAKKPGQLGREDFADVDAWTFSDLKTVRRVTLSYQDDLDFVNKLAEDLIHQITAIKNVSAKLETQHQELKRFIDMKDDTKIAELVKARGLGPEQEENRTRLLHLYQLVSERVEQLESHVEAQKKKLSMAKDGKTAMQVPTLELITRSLNRIQTGAKLRLEELTNIAKRLESLSLDDVEQFNPMDEDKPSKTLPATNGSNNLNKRPSRGPVDPAVWASAVSALNSERSAARLKAVVLEVRAGEAPRWNRTVLAKKKNADAARPALDLTRTLRLKNTTALPSWVKPEPVSEPLSHLVAPLARRPSQDVMRLTPVGVGIGNPVPSFSFGPAATQAGPQYPLNKTLPKQPNNGTPPKLRPLPKTRRGFGMRFEDDD